MIKRLDMKAKFRLCVSLDIRVLNAVQDGTVRFEGREKWIECEQSGFFCGWFPLWCSIVPFCGVKCT